MSIFKCSESCSPFGMPQPGRQYVGLGGDYRYGFNGMEKDNEVSGNGNSYTAQFWQYDSRLMRRWNTDPVVKHHESPYATFAGNPIWFVDPLGNDTTFMNHSGVVESRIISDSRNVVYQYSDWIGEGENKYRTRSKVTFNDDNDLARTSDFAIGEQMMISMNQENINFILGQSGITKIDGLYDRWSFAEGESSGGVLDFPLILFDNAVGLRNIPDGATQNDVLNMGPFITISDGFENSDYHYINRAYNIFDAGQFLWGQAMKRTGFSESTALWGANLNEWHRGGDSALDQMTIRQGFLYTPKTSVSSEHEILRGLEFNRTPQLRDYRDRIR